MSAADKAYNMFSGQAAEAATGVASTTEDLSKKLTDALTKPESTTLPAVSLTMADVSARLAALEDAVADLRKKVSPEPAKTAVEIKDLLPSGGSRRSGKKKRKTRKASRKNRRRN